VAIELSTFSAPYGTSVVVVLDGATVMDNGDSTRQATARLPQEPPSIRSSCVVLC